MQYIHEVNLCSMLMIVILKESIHGKSGRGGGVRMLKASSRFAGH